MSFAIFAAICAGAAYAVMLWKQKRLTADDEWALVALGVAAVAFLFLKAGGIAWMDQWAHEKHDARQRRFWRERVERERRQHQEQEQIDAERAERRRRRRSEAGE